VIKKMSLTQKRILLGFMVTLMVGSGIMAMTQPVMAGGGGIPDTIISSDADIPDTNGEFTLSFSFLGDVKNEVFQIFDGEETPLATIYDTDPLTLPVSVFESGIYQFYYIAYTTGFDSKTSNVIEVVVGLSDIEPTTDCEFGQKILIKSAGESIIDIWSYDVNGDDLTAEISIRDWYESENFIAMNNVRENEFEYSHTHTVSYEEGDNGLYVLHFMVSDGKFFSHYIFYLEVCIGKKPVEVANPSEPEQDDTPPEITVIYTGDYTTENSGELEVSAFEDKNRGWMNPNPTDIYGVPAYIGTHIYHFTAINVWDMETHVIYEVIIEEENAPIIDAYYYDDEIELGETTWLHVVVSGDVTNPSQVETDEGLIYEKDIISGEVFYEDIIEFKTVGLHEMTFTVSNEHGTTTLVLEVNVICPVANEIQALIKAVQESPDETWKNNAEDRRNTIINKLNDLSEMCGKWKPFMNKLNNDIKPKLTGENSKWAIGYIVDNYADFIGYIINSIPIN
jgi:hypothetical protein